MVYKQENLKKLFTKKACAIGKYSKGPYKNTQRVITEFAGDKMAKGFIYALHLESI